MIHSAATIERVAGELSRETARTPRAIETRLQFYLSRSTVRAVLAHLVREGRAIADGDIYQKRYRLASTGRQVPVGAALAVLIIDKGKGGCMPNLEQRRSADTRADGK